MADIIRFYCDLYRERFGVEPERIGKTNLFQIRGKVIALSGLRKALWPSVPMTGETKAKLRQLAEERKRAGVKPRCKTVRRKKNASK